MVYSIFLWLSFKTLHFFLDLFLKLFVLMIQFLNIHLKVHNFLIFLCDLSISHRNLVFKLLFSVSKFRFLFLNHFIFCINLTIEYFLKISWNNFALEFFIFLGLIFRQQTKFKVYSKYLILLNVWASLNFFKFVDNLGLACVILGV